MMKYYALLFSFISTSVLVAACSQQLIPKAESVPEAEPPVTTILPPVNTGGVTPSKNVVYPKGVKRPQLSEHELRLISNHIYFNETSSKPENLMKWNDNEHFVSLGIGHFIWYPAGVRQRFDQTFPDLITYLQDHHVRIPYWLLSAKNKGAPWPNKQAFLQSQNDPEVRELKRILLNTKELQTLFFFDRIHESIPTIVRLAPENKRKLMIRNYNAVANTTNGWYPLIDYINFKGKGIKLTERYNGQGWGLSQVLQEMRPVTAGPQALQEFSRAALFVLERRLNNAPDENNEDNWLPGWRNRISTYTQPL
jgi:hypothetical protein